MCGERGGGRGVGEGWVGGGAVSFAGLHLRSSVPKAGMASFFQTTGRLEPRGKIIFCSDRLSWCYCDVGFPSLHNPFIHSFILSYLSLFLSIYT